VGKGIVWREEQTASYRHLNEGLADDNPQGCQKGASYSLEMYSQGRLRHPLKRVGPRGSRRWRRVSWDEALLDIAKAIIEVVRDEGSDKVCIPLGTQGHEAKSRFGHALGAVLLDPAGEVGDALIGAMMTTGTQMHAGSSDSRLLSDCIISWVYNQSATRIADVHHLHEARYSGATIISISPDQSPTHVHADYWVNPKPGTDHGLALAMAHVIVRDKLYDAAFLKEQTDLPFLVRKDTRKFLRASDLSEGGAEDLFYIWDLNQNTMIHPLGSLGSADKTLSLGNVDPALEGNWQIRLPSGSSVEITTVFEILKESLNKNTPTFAETVTGIGTGTIEKIARIYAKAGTALVQCGAGMLKMYHGDLVQRAVYLLSSLTGNIGKVGGGVWTGSFLEGVPGRSIPDKYANGRHRIVPGSTWLYVHGGLSEVSSRWIPVPNKKTGHEYIMQALQQEWVPIWPKPGQDPRILIECGSNLLRRTRMNHILKEKLWPKFRLAVTIDFRMSSSALYSDYVLPTAGYYETSAIKYSDTHSPYHVLGVQAVEPVGESQQEWWIFAELCKRIQALAPGMGITEYEDQDLNLTRNLADIYDVFTENGRYPEDISTLDLVREDVATKGGLYQQLSFDEFLEQGQANWTWEGTKHSPGVAPSFVFESGQPHADSTDHTKRKTPWRTLTGRLQFYLDHDWFLEFGEELPVWATPPLMGGEHPFRFTCGHARWSVHSFMRDNELMLQQQRGVPIVYMNDEDARKRDIEDHEKIEVFNDVGRFEVHVKTTPSMQPGQLHSYHAWETFMFKDGNSHAAIMASQLKPLNVVGDYGHLRYSPGFYQANNVDKGSTCDVRKLIR
tara:strand:- start:1269 stop:3794 length:2526 start_codon:yes stop_codon:yes gene_type:complete